MSPTEESSKGAGCCVTIREELDLDGFPFDEQFGGGLESGGQLFWTRSAEPGTTTPHCLAWLQGCALREPWEML